MKLTKAFYLLFILTTFSFSALSQRLPFKGCESDSCHQVQFESLMKKAEALLFEKAGFAYNDSVAITLVQQKGKVRFLDFHAWVNPKAKYGYLKVIHENRERLALEDSMPYTFYWKQEVEVPARTVDDMRTVPSVEGCESYNSQAKKGCYRYLYSGYLKGFLPKVNFKDLLSADLIFKRGKLTAINYLCPPLNQKVAIDLGPIFLSIEKRVEIPKNYSDDSTYSLRFHYPGYKIETINELKTTLFEDYWSYYYRNNLWKPLKALCASFGQEGENGQIILGQDYESMLNSLNNNLDGKRTSELTENIELLPMDYMAKMMLINISAYEFLERCHRDKIIEKRWWESSLISKSSDTARTIAFKSPTCDTISNLEDQIACYRNSPMRGLNLDYRFPEMARQMRAPPIKMLIYFCIDQNGRIRKINIVRPVILVHSETESLVFAGIDAISRIKDFVRYGLSDNDYEEMGFYLPLTARLQ